MKKIFQTLTHLWSHPAILKYVVLCCNHPLFIKISYCNIFPLLEHYVIATDFFEPISREIPVKTSRSNSSWSQKAWAAPGFYVLGVPSLAYHWEWQRLCSFIMSLMFYYSWIVSMCFFRDPESVKDFPQESHLWFLWPSWSVLMWFFRLSDRVKYFPQELHLKFLEPSWWRFLRW